MRYVLALATVVLLCTLLPRAYGDELSLGLWSHHFDRDVKEDECVNEEHNLVSYAHKNIVAGGYRNSNCNDSYLLGYQGEFTRIGDHSFGYTISAVSGYSKSMHVVDGLIVIPMLHYSYTYKGDGVRLYYIPQVLVATGFIFRF
tara:strand:- start:2912 stop:3343 length:432 start_codon:yes stop_codon:yes gene_type:complete